MELITLNRNQFRGLPNIGKRWEEELVNIFDRNEVEELIELINHRTFVHIGGVCTRFLCSESNIIRYHRPILRGLWSYGAYIPKQLQNLVFPFANIPTFNLLCIAPIHLNRCCFEEIKSGALALAKLQLLKLIGYSFSYGKFHRCPPSKARFGLPASDALNFFS